MMFNLKEQLEFKPEILNPEAFDFDNVIVGGMGGSALPARAIFYLDPVYSLWLHNDYGLPQKVEGKPLLIAISYSGNTAETVSFAREAYEKNLPLAIITSGGQLKEFAEQESIAHVLVPRGLEPRDAMIYMLKALLLMLGRKNILGDGGKAEEVEKEARELASFIFGADALVYSSREDLALGYIWKIYLNESAKMPAFCNFFPELFHNELESLDSNKKIILLSSAPKFLEMAEDKGWLVRRVEFGNNKAENLVRNLVLARSTARILAQERGVDPDKALVIDEFKKRLK